MFDFTDLKRYNSTILANNGLIPDSLEPYRDVKQKKSGLTKDNIVTRLNIRVNIVIVY